MKYVEGPKVVQDGKRGGLEDFAPPGHGEGQDAQCAAACASVKRLLGRRRRPPSAMPRTLGRATAAPSGAPRGGRTRSTTPPPSGPRRSPPSAARPADVDGKVVLLQADLDAAVDEDIDEDDLPEAFLASRKRASLTAAKAVLLVTELAEGSTAWWSRSSTPPAPTGRRASSGYCRPSQGHPGEGFEDEEAIPLLVLEVRNAGPALCTVIDREIADEDAPGPYLADADDARLLKHVKMPPGERRRLSFDGARRYLSADSLRLPTHNVNGCTTRPPFITTLHLPRSQD